MNMFGILIIVICAFSAISILLNGLRRLEKSLKEEYRDMAVRGGDRYDELTAELVYQRENNIHIPPLPDYDNWDDCGAHAITKDARAMLKAMQIFPADNGGINIAWHMNGQDLEFQIGPDGKICEIDFEEGEKCWTYLREDGKISCSGDIDIQACMELELEELDNAESK